MKSLFPNLKHLRIFLKVIQTESIRKTSSEIYLSQSAATQAIIKLEKSLNVNLFDRQSNGMYVSEAGKIYEIRVQRAFNFIHEGLKKIIDCNSVQKNRTVKYIIQSITTTQLNALIAVNEVKNYNLAGRNIHISKSSLHRSVRDLEGLIQISFFSKIKNGIESSKEAEILAKAAKLAFSELVQGSYEVSSLSNNEKGTISIGCMPVSRASFLPIAINQFSSAYPDYNFIVNDGQYNDLLYHLRYGDSDIMIGALRYPIPNRDIVQEKLLDSTLCIVARSDHPLCSKSKITPKCLSEYPWVVPHKSSPAFQAFNSIFNAKNSYENVCPSQLIETTSQIFMLNVLVGSDRLSIVSEDQIQKPFSRWTFVQD